MDFSNSGSSVYHGVQSVYARSKEGNYLHVSGYHNNYSDHGPPLEGQRPKVIEFDRGAYATGIVLSTITGHSNSTFSTEFSNLIARRTRLDVSALPVTVDKTTSRTAAALIADVFDSTVRNEGPKDQWHLQGRQFFEDKVHVFTQRAAKIEFCLPAFPCKSSNLNKVAGTAPDKGEELALRRMHEFVEAIGEVYQPGAKLWIVSDGHVFSDCIGVDDDAVDLYNQRLTAMNTHIALEHNPNAVEFLSLSDLFFPEDSGGESSRHTELSGTQLDNVLHPIPTIINKDAENCRKILLAGCGINTGTLREQIDGRDLSILRLYRGFSKFMLEDLSTHANTKAMSRSQCRKLSSKIAFEMIKRNQAYSNLIEMLFPLHVRLSIHSHNNSGPKFGTNLLSSVLCRLASSASEAGNEALDSPDLLHIPTPWHNCVFTIDGGPIYFVAKSKVVQDAVSSGLYSGDWVEGELGYGGYFHLRKSLAKTNISID